MSQAELAQRTGMSEGHLSRLESGSRRLNMDAMRSISAALECAPEDLISHGSPLPMRDDVEAAEFQGFPGLSDALAQAGGTRVYRVVADSVTDAGIKTGMTIVVQESVEAVNRAKTGDIVVAMIANTMVRVLRQFVEPCTLITNRHGANSIGRTDDRSAPMRIVGLVVRVATP